MKVKIALFSDTHQEHAKVILPECDIALFAGDLSHQGRPGEVKSFLEWYNNQHQASIKIFVAGNHDLSFDPLKSYVYTIPTWLQEGLAINTNLTYLCNNSCEAFGLKIWGSPITPDFFPEYWAFNKPRGASIRQVWQSIPNDTDIVISHGPAKGLLDFVPSSHYASGQYPSGNVGCVDLLDRLYQLPNLKLVLCGHIHQNYGIEDIYMGDRIVKYVNGAVVDNQNYLIHQPMLIELDV